MHSSVCVHSVDSLGTALRKGFVGGLKLGVSKCWVSFLDDARVVPVHRNLKTLMFR